MGSKYEIASRALPMEAPLKHLRTLPGCRGLARLADLAPVIIVDTREQAPLMFKSLSSFVGTLVSGDYAPAGLEHLIAIERKTADDLIGSLTRERDRFERELHRLRGFHFARVLVTCSRDTIKRGEYRSKASPAAILASIAAFEVRYRVPFVFVNKPTTAAELVENWIWYAAREVVANANDLLRGCERSLGHLSQMPMAAVPRPVA